MNQWIKRWVGLWCIVGGLSVILTSCLGNRNWEYPPPPSGAFVGIKAARPLPVRVLVLPFEDIRGAVVQEEYWKAAIPFVPYGVTRYDRPEAISQPEPVDQITFHPPVDFAKAMAAELRAAGLFSAVEFVQHPDPALGDLALRGRLKSTEWRRELWTYLLGPLGVVFWIVGAPMGNTTTMVEMDVMLTPVDDPSRILWAMSMEFEGKKWDSPYYNLEDAVLSYPVALQEALKPAIADLVHLAESNPRRFLVRR
ncbi:MAG: hypothetical protein D6690_03575 [Nitrospirae bacterium]|nr:MAG: hypothetical protein D6690_03575 [Nitrospirota bacterium]